MSLVDCLATALSIIRTWSHGKFSEMPENIVAQSCSDFIQPRINIVLPSVNLYDGISMDMTRESERLIALLQQGETFYKSCGSIPSRVLCDPFRLQPPKSNGHRSQVEKIGRSSTVGLRCPVRVTTARIREIQHKRQARFGVKSLCDLVTPIHSGVLLRCQQCALSSIQIVHGVNCHEVRFLRMER